MEDHIHLVDISNALLHPPRTKSEWPTFLLQRTARPAEAAEVTGLPKKYWPRAGRFWVAKSRLTLPSEDVDWAIVKEGDIVAIPVFLYLTLPEADISLIIGGVAQSIRVAVEAANLHLPEPMQAMHLVQSRIFDLRPQAQQYRYALGVAFSY